MKIGQPKKAVQPCSLGVLSMLAALIWALPAAAQAPHKSLVNTPVYNTATKSYFELHIPVIRGKGMYRVIMSGTINWRLAHKIASSRAYHGTRGRLAVVKNMQVHKFLREKFKLAVAAWIGLRYWCKFRKLQWVTGEIHTRKGFARWGRIWNEGVTSPGQQKRANCAPKPRYHLGVHYWGTEFGFFWNANGINKEFSALFIEFPTGKP